MSVPVASKGSCDTASGNSEQSVEQPAWYQEPMHERGDGVHGFLICSIVLRLHSPAFLVRGMEPGNDIHDNVLPIHNCSKDATLCINHHYSDHLLMLTATIQTM